MASDAGEVVGWGLRWQIPSLHSGTWCLHLFVAEHRRRAEESCGIRRGYSEEHTLQKSCEACRAGKPQAHSGQRQT